MIDPEVRRFIQEEIKKSMNVILSGSSLNAGTDKETIQKLFPSMPSIKDRPTMMPYGHASKAPDNTIQVVGRQGDHFANRIILGHRAKDRPKDINQGEIVLYNQFGQKIYIRNKKMQFGTEGSDENMVLGKVLAQFWTDFLRSVLDAPYIGTSVIGPVFLLRELRDKLEEFILKYIQDIETNILSKMCFTERGEQAEG